MIAAWLVAAVVGQAAAAVPHPDIPCWTGTRNWTAPGEPPSAFVIWGTAPSPIEVTIEHHRDHIRNRGAVEQDYNFLSYRFPSSAAVDARVYLDNPGTVMVMVRGSGSIRSLARLREAAGADIVCYLQQRFHVIEAWSGNRGYQPVWRAEPRSSRP